MSAYASEIAVTHAPRSRSAVVVGYVLAFFGALPALVWAIGTRLDLLLSLPALAGTGSIVAGGAFALGGAAWMVWSMASLSVRGRGLPISHLPPAALVVRGPHARMRHPIYVGYALAIAGAGIASGSIGRGVLASALLYSCSIIYAVAFEEPRLRARFGSEYAAYAERVPAFPLGGMFATLTSRTWARLRGPAERLANRVVLFRVGPAIFVTFGAFAAAGAAVGLAILNVLVGAALRETEQFAYLVGLALWMLACARLLALLYRLRRLLDDPLDALRAVGFVSWGGYIGLFTFPFAFAWLTLRDGAWLMDRTFLAALVCSCFGRIGCLTYGCCYGARSARGIAWTHPDAKPQRELADREAANATRTPTQLLSAIYVASTIPIVLVVMSRSAPGAATAIGAIIYATARFAVECRRDEPRFTSLALTRGQLFALGGFSVAIAVLLVGRFEGAAAPVVARGPVSAAGWLAIAATAVVTFLVCGLHWRRVGRW